eukprot:15658-Heterococcus_DN1.PRE.1
MLTQLLAIATAVCICERTIDDGSKRSRGTIGESHCATAARSALAACSEYVTASSAYAMLRCSVRVLCNNTTSGRLLRTTTVNAMLRNTINLALTCDLCELSLLYTVTSTHTQAPTNAAAVPSNDASVSPQSTAAATDAATTDSSSTSTTTNAAHIGAAVEAAMVVAETLLGPKCKTVDSRAAAFVLAAQLSVSVTALYCSATRVRHCDSVNLYN